MQRLNALLANRFSDADLKFQNSIKLQNAPNSKRQIKCWRQIHIKREWEEESAKRRAVPADTN